jgi:hypothetical protein
MKLLFFVLLAVTLSVSCKTNTKQELDNQSSEKQTGISQAEIISHVKNRPITNEITVGQMIDLLAGSDGIASWQISEFKEYANDKDIVGVVGSTQSDLFGSTLIIKVAYIYQLSTKKVIYHKGFMNNKGIKEYELISMYEEKKMLDSLLN